LEVAENRALESGRKISLRVVVMPARGVARRPPLFVLTGGPGLAATGLERYANAFLGGARQARDIVLVDQRGTGESAPLNCGLYDEGGRLQPYLDPMFPLARVRACQARLEKTADLTQYTSTNSADDIDDARRALGAEQIALFGVSYGARLALVYLRRHEAHVERLVGQGVPPPQEPIRTNARTIQRALDSLIADCRADPSCRAQVPDPRADLNVLLDRLTAAPAHLSFWSWRRLSHEMVEVTRRDAAEGLWRELYSPTAGRRVLPLVHLAAAGDVVPLTRALIRLSQGTRSDRSEGLMLSILCSEDAPRLTANDAVGDSSAMLDTPVNAELIRACAAWPHGVVPAEFGSPVQSDVPVLLLSGARDPVAPPEWASSAARTLTNSVHLVDPRSGHAQMNGCVVQTIADFYELSGKQRLRPGCLSAASDSMSIP
jgi:pimeloyl-ACP methyl ester carboxylesterase